MKIYIIDDDKNICCKLMQIIEDENLGQVIGYSTNPVESLDELQYLDVNLILVDLLMPKLDGINFVKKLKSRRNAIECIMISQVENKDMIAKAYNEGIKFFVKKPINKIEIKQVITNVSEIIEYKNKFDYLNKIFNDSRDINTDWANNVNIKMKRILIELGIWGEKGTEEIMALAKHIYDNKICLSETSLTSIVEKIDDNGINFEQRMRRAISKGLTNIAAIGIEDNLNSTFVEYSNTLYDFEFVKKEMEYLRGNIEKGGKINLKKFIDNLLNIIF